MNWTQGSKRIKKLKNRSSTTLLPGKGQHILNLFCHICCRYTEYENARALVFFFILFYLFFFYFNVYSQEVPFLGTVI